MVSPLKALSNLIAQSVDAIEGECEKQGLSFPSIDGAFTVDSEAIRNSPSVAKEIALICAAAQQLSLIVRPPNASLVMQAAGVSLNAFRAIDTTLTFRAVRKLCCAESSNRATCLRNSPCLW